MGLLANIFGYAVDDVPYGERDFLGLGGGLDKGERVFAISFDYILKTGTVPSGNPINDLDNKNHNTHTIDWDADDAFIRSFDRVKNNVIASIRTDPDAQALLQKSVWTQEDRVAWEQCVSRDTTIMCMDVDAFKDYRILESGSNSPIEGQGNLAKTNSLHLNDLSHDILNGTNEMEYVCGDMTVVEGAILQEIDSFFLPEQNTPENYKTASNYYYTSGDLTGAGEAFDREWRHAYIVSSSTGNVIEATAEFFGQYVEVDAENHSFDQFVKIGLVENKRGDKYSLGYPTEDEFKATVEEFEAMRVVPTPLEVQPPSESIMGAFYEGFVGVAEDIYQSAVDVVEDTYQSTIGAAGRLYKRTVDSVFENETVAFIDSPRGVIEGIYDREDSRFRPAVISVDGRSSLFNYKHLSAVNQRVSYHMRDSHLSGPVERAADGRIANFDKIDFLYPSNLIEYERAIDAEIQEQEVIMNADDSYILPRWMRSGDSVHAYNDSRSELQILNAAKEELAAYKAEVREKGRWHQSAQDLSREAEVPPSSLDEDAIKSYMKLREEFISAVNVKAPDEEEVMKAQAAMIEAQAELETTKDLMKAIGYGNLEP